jgi:hypothetical protein
MNRKLACPYPLKQKESQNQPIQPKTIKKEV